MFVKMIKIDRNKGKESLEKERWKRTRDRKRDTLRHARETPRYARYL